MSNRRPLSLVLSGAASRAFSVSGAGLFVAVGLLTGCSQPAPVEPPPPPESFSDVPQGLYGAPASGMAAMAECPADPYPVPPPPQCLNGAQAYAQADPYAPPMGAPMGPMPEAMPGTTMEPAPMAEPQRREGWGTMDPIPDPQDRRAFAEASGTTGRTPEDSDRQAYADAARAAPAPAPYVEPYRTEAPMAEGVPASANPPVVVTMEPVPNPDGSERAALRRGAAADAALAGAPARPRAAAEPRRQPRAERSPGRSAGAPAVRRPVVTARPASRADAPAKRADRRPDRSRRATPPATRAVGLDQLRNALTDLVRRDATFTAPGRITPGQTETVTLTLPAGLAAGLAQEAERANLKSLASEARIRATLSGDGWRIVPADPQTETVRPGQATTFDWQATASPGARPLSADIAAELSGGRGAVETLELGQREQALDAGPANGPIRGLSARAWAAAVLLLLALLGVFYFLRRKDDGAVVGSSGRSRRRRHRDPVNLTPYSPAADAPAAPKPDAPV